MCDGNVCDDKVCDGCVKAESQDDDYTFTEFVTNLKHEKCKVIQLVRGQIHKFEDTEILPIGSSTRETMNQFEMERESLIEEENRTKMPMSIIRTVSQQLIMQPQTWMEHTYLRLCNKFILVILLISALLLFMFCCGLLKVFLCGSSRFYLTPFKYFHAKRIVF